MICTTIGKRSPKRRLLACAVALVACLWAAPTASAAWQRTAVGAGGATGVYLTLKKNLLGRFSDQFSRMGDAFLKDDDQAFLEAVKEHDEAPLHIVRDSSPVFAAASAVGEAAGETLRGMAASVKRKAGLFVGRAREAAVDARVALTGIGRKSGGLAREIFDPEPLPEVKVFSRPRPVPASAWDAKSPVSAAAKASPWDAQGPAAGKADPWAKSAWDPDPVPKGKPASPAKPSSFRERAAAEQRARPNCYGVVSEDCDDNYREALARMTGEVEGSYEEQLTALEARERARLAEKAERERLEAERRTRELAERREAERRRVEAKKERRRARLAAKEARRRAQTERNRARLAAKEARWRAEAQAGEQGGNLIEIFAGMAQGVAEYYSSKHQQELQHEQRVAEQRRRQTEIAWQRQQEQERQQEQAWRKQQQRRQEEQRRLARVRQEEEERRRRQEAERQRREAERQRREAERQQREAERLAKAARRAACRRQISGARNGCVQVVKWHGVGAFGGTYTLRNSCSYSVQVWHGRPNRRLDSLMTISPGGTRDTAPVFGEPYNDGSMRFRRLRISYLACYDNPGVSGRGGSCELTSSACAGVE